MRVPLAWLISFLLLSAGGLVAFSLSRGQDSVHVWKDTPAQPAPKLQWAGTEGESGAIGVVPVPDKLSEMPPLKRQFHLSAQRGADWLAHTNRADGRFDYGFQPALMTRLEGDHYLCQAGAAYALAQAARYFNDERLIAVARQAVLALLLETEKGKSGRTTALPSVAVNRLGAVGLLVLAINELPAPTDELLGQSEEMCQYIQSQQQADGSLSYIDAPGSGEVTIADPEGINHYPGEALCALMRSQRHRPAPWKTEVVRKALAYYRPWWQKNKNMVFVPWQTAAYAEAYLQNPEAGKPFAEFVTEMNDWVCSLQVTTLDARHPMWLGGFMGYAEGKPVPGLPQIGSATYVEGLVSACRVAVKAGDVTRSQRYRDALERGLQFAVTLQYTDANTQHFTDWYRPRLLGGFHASDQDGDLRIDYNQHAVCALVQYLEYVSAQ